jgi:hypothetical protein
VKQVVPHSTQKWATFRYVGRETSYITNIFRRTELKISFHTTNTLGNLLTHKHHPQDKFSLSGVYPQGSMKRGRPKTSWRRSVIKEAGRSWNELRFLAADRQKWKELIDNLCS